jgi:hypothetical protein
MKTISTKAILALMTATLGLSAVAPVLAQQGAPTAPLAQTEQAQQVGKGFRPGYNGPGRSGGNDLLNFERGAEAVEIALVRLGHRLDLTDAQKTLFETLKADALTAANTLKAAAETVRQTSAAEGETPSTTTLADRLETRIALDTARLDALKSVQPSLTAFFDSLTDEQKAELVPERGEHRNGPRINGQRSDGQRPDGQRPGGAGAPTSPNNG